MATSKSLSRIELRPLNPPPLNPPYKGHRPRRLKTVSSDAVAAFCPFTERIVPTCSDRGDCNPNGFVLKSFQPRGMTTELFAVQCPDCGRTYGIVEDYNFRATYTQITRAIKAIADHLGVEVDLHTG